MEAQTVISKINKHLVSRSVLFFFYSLIVRSLRASQPEPEASNKTFKGALHALCRGENAHQVKNTQAWAQRECRPEVFISLSVVVCTPACFCVRQRLCVICIVLTRPKNSFSRKRENNNNTGRWTNGENKKREGSWIKFLWRPSLLSTLLHICTCFLLTNYSQPAF